MRTALALFFSVSLVSAGELVELTYYDANGNPVQMRVDRSEVAKQEPKAPEVRGVTVRPSTDYASRRARDYRSSGRAIYGYSPYYYSPSYRYSGHCATPYRASYPSAYISRPITRLSYGNSTFLFRW